MMNLYEADPNIEEAKILCNKLKLMFVFEKMEMPLTENSIIDICTRPENDYLTLGYMDVKEMLWQLLQVKLMYTTVKNESEVRYGLTNEGRNCLMHFYQRVPQSVRDRISVFCKEHRMEFKRSQEYLSEYSKNADGSHTVTLRIVEPEYDTSLIEVKLKAPTRASAIDACKKWIDQAPSVYEYVYETMIDEEDE